MFSRYSAANRASRILFSTSRPATQRRNARTRPRAGGRSSDPLAQDEKLLKKLEDQLSRVKDKLRREEEQEERKLQAAAEAFARAKKGESDELSLANHNEYFWKQVLTPEDRYRLACIGLDSMEELYEAYREAENMIKDWPSRSLESIDPGLHIAHQIYNSIPEKIGQVTRATQRKGIWW